jgi:hypothetical protein
MHCSDSAEHGPAAAGFVDDGLESRDDLFLVGLVLQELNS